MHLFAKFQEGGSAYPVKGTEIQEDALQFGMTYRTLRRAADEMKIVKSGRGGRHVTWSLPPEILEALVGEPDETPAPEVAQPSVEEPALEKMLDQGRVPSDDAAEWERNKPKDDAPSTEFDAEFDEFLANLEDGKDAPDAQA
jgi:hypothetical protein